MTQSSLYAPVFNEYPQIKCCCLLSSDHTWILEIPRYILQYLNAEWIKEHTGFVNLILGYIHIHKQKHKSENIQI